MNGRRCSGARQTTGGSSVRAWWGQTDHWREQCQSVVGPDRPLKGAVSERGGSPCWDSSCPDDTQPPTTRLVPSAHRTTRSSALHPTSTTACKLQALVYDILPSNTAVFSYATGSRKLSANEQFFVGAQTVVCLLQTTQIKQGVPFIAANK